MSQKNSILYKAILELIDDYDIKEIDTTKAIKALAKVDQILIKVGFPLKKESAISYLLDKIWHQAEKEYNNLL